jgi:hypothetical protein
MSRALLDKSGRVVGACDSGFDRLGRRPWQPRTRPAQRVAVDRAPIDINVEIPGPTMADTIPGYTRLR